MNPYQHLTTGERERIFVMHEQGETLEVIGRELKRSPSTISRELNRNSQHGLYSPSEATRLYAARKQKCGRKRVFTDTKIFDVVKHFFLEEQWSPEEIDQRLKHEKSSYQVSYNTIYRAIYRGDFNETGLSHGNRGAVRKLRHRGKTRHTKGHIERRGKIQISNTIHERPLAADDRTEIGHWELDTVTGKTGKACAVTMVDRYSRFCLIGKADKKKSAEVAQIVLALTAKLPIKDVKTITPDRGKEFAKHVEITEETGIEFYFPDPHAPWQRGTNENTNNLLREYLPKSQDMSDIPAPEFAEYAHKLNTRPKKCLGWRTPYEVFYNETLHLI